MQVKRMKDPHTRFTVERRLGETPSPMRSPSVAKPRLSPAARGEPHARNCRCTECSLADVPF